MESRVCYFGLATLPDGIYITGGVDFETKKLLKSVVKFNPDELEWSILPDMQ